MDYRISERAMVTSCAVGILIVMLGNRRQSLMMSAVGAAVMVLGILQALVFYKCPHCKKRFKIGSRAAERLPVLRCEARRGQPAGRTEYAGSGRADRNARRGTHRRKDRIICPTPR